MKTAGIVSIGNELLSGRVTDTNAAWLGRQLRLVGIDVTSCYTVGDDIESIVKMLKYACVDCDVVLVTGGLGPTDDDVTRQAVAKLLGVELEFHPELLEKIEQYFACRCLKMVTKNEIQAYIPAASEAIANNAGTAPGFAAEFNGRKIFVMPGVPREMEKMFAESVLDQIKQSANGQKIAVQKLYCCGTGESNIAEKLGDLMRRDRNPLINCTASAGMITLEVVAKAQTSQKAKQMVAEDVKLLGGILGELVFGTDDETLASAVGEKLRSQNKTLAVAESCTAGLLAKMITDPAGSSDYFLGGWITYSNESKIAHLGVKADTIKKYGAVSKQAAEEMADGVRAKSGADFAISITGIAGPGGGTDEKPVGLVYITISCQDGCETGRFIFGGNRAAIRLRTAITALNMLRLRR